MALQREIWLSDIQEKLFTSNRFIQRGIDDSSFSDDNKTIHIPQAGATGVVKKNPTIKPLPIAQRTDSDLSYDVDEFTYGPILIEDAEQAELSYSKRDSITRDHISELNDKMGDTAAEKWALPNITGANAARYVNTSGNNGVANNPAGGAARKKLVVADIHKLMSKIMAANAYREEDRPCLLIHPFMLAELRQDLDSKNHRLIEERSALGAIGNYGGFDIFVRSKVPIYDNSNVFSKVDGTSATATDNFGAIAFCPSMVSYGMTGIEIYENSRDAAYQGDILSARVRFGANPRRLDGNGLFAIIQA